MNFTDYKARIFAFQKVFFTLFQVPEIGKRSATEAEEIKKIVISTLQDWMYNFSDIDYVPTIPLMLTDYLEMFTPEDLESDDSEVRTETDDFIVGDLNTLSMGKLKTLKDVNLLADYETLVKQAEAVRDEIITHGKLLKLLFTHDQNVNKKNYPHIISMIEFIRTPRGKIVYPFDYWQDCVEVYLRKHLFGYSNEKIAKELNFITSKSGTTRAKLGLVADMLNEINLLKEMVINNSFPPKVLYGTKQPRIKTS